MRVICWYALLSIAAAAAQAQPDERVYLSDQRHRIVYLEQGWGELGIDRCAHSRGQEGQPLTIGEKKYDKGLGHHAPGELIVLLSGEFARFESDLGVQTAPGGPGSVVFKIFVDEQEKFDSGVMTSATSPKPVSIPVEGATELRLVATDAGDGLTSDCANWAAARLVRSATAATRQPGSGMDVAPFAQVVTCDPARLEGARATRIQEYHAEDVFLETPLRPEENGMYLPGRFAETQCIGLKWLERRLLSRLEIELDGKPSLAGVQVQCWVGPGLWQGQWQPLGGAISDTPEGFRLDVDWSKVPDARGGTRKIRWILPGSKPLRVRRLAATATALTGNVPLRITCEKAPSAGAARVKVYNGELIDASGQVHFAREWSPAEPIALNVRYVKPRKWQKDQTVLRFHLGDAAFGVAVDDVLRHGGVYVRDTGLFVSLADSGRDAAGYRASIRDHKTVLQRVREMPDQTLAQAIEHVHNPKQNLQPMLLSLACDNHKFVVQRDGTIQFAAEPDVADLFRVHQLTYPRQLSPKFGSGNGQVISRHLEGGWLPAPVTRVRDGGYTYQQRTYVVSEQGGRGADSPWLEPHPVCVVEYSLEGQPEPGQDRPRLQLTFLADVKANQSAQVGPWEVTHKGKRIAALTGLDARLRVKAEVGTLTVEWPMGGGPVLQLVLYGHEVDADPSPGPVSIVPEPFERFEAYWRRVMAPAMQVELPDPLLTNVMRASQVHCLLVARNEDDGRRIAPWIAAFVYGPLESESNSIVRGMDYWGHHEFSRRGLDFFINKYAPSGMLTTGYTLMGTGWHLWSLGEHYRLTRARDWLRGVASEVASACDWIVQQRRKTQKEFPTGRPPEYGLAPPGVMADWYSYNYFFCLNGYYYKGLNEAAQALAGIEHPGADVLVADAAEFREDILRAYHWTRERMPVYPLKDGTSVPGYPSQLTAPGPTNNFFPGEDGNRSWCYDVELGAHQLVPQGVLDAGSREVGEMMDHMEDVQFLADGWFDFQAQRNEKDWYNLGGFAKVQPYYCRNIEIYALRDDVRPFIRSYFNTIPSLLGMETLSFQEHFAGVAAWNKTHETGYFLHYSRLMLVQERGNELWLMPFVPTEWLEDGKRISVRNSPTAFGPVHYEVTSHIKDGYIEADVTWPSRQKPRSVVLRVRHPSGKPVKQWAVNGEKIEPRPDNRDVDLVRLDSGPASKVRIEF